MTDTEFALVRVKALQESPLNPRKHFDPTQLEELAESIRQKGIITPLLVRPIENEYFEIAAGHRRFRAAQIAGLDKVPALVREMSEQDFVEVLTIENLQRADLHPLEEADGFQTLARSGYDVARIAERVGRSAKYVYDRMKLAGLIPEVREIFFANRITAGHAIVLARLDGKDQARAIDPDRGGLWSAERLLWNPDGPGDDDGSEKLKANSVRELQGWIDQHVKFDTSREDLPDLFTATAATLEQAEKVVSITREHYVQPDARDENRIIGPRSWTRADGEHKSKVCEHAVTGVVVIGPGRGEAFKVCVAKKTCKVHWAKEQREAKRRAKGGTGNASSQQSSRAKEEEKRKLEHEENLRQEKRWAKALPDVLTELAACVSKAPTKADGLLGKLLVSALANWQVTSKAAEVYVPLGKSTDDLVRHLAFMALMADAKEWNAHKDFPKQAKAFGLEVAKIVDRVAPAEAMHAATPAKATKKSTAKRKKVKR